MEFIKSTKIDIIILCLLFASISINAFYFFSKDDLTQKDIERQEAFKRLEIENKTIENSYKIQMSLNECILDSIKLHYSKSKTKIIYKYEKDSINFISSPFNEQLDIWTRHTKN